MESSVRASIVLNDMQRTHEAAYGFRSWILQDMDEPYEVVLNLFNDKESLFENLMQGGNPNCQCRIQSYPPPAFFNISAANNLGLARSTGQYVLFANSDIIYPQSYLRTLTGELARRDLCYLLGSRVDLSEEETGTLRPASVLTSFDFLNDERKGRRPGILGSPWTIRRDVAMQVGGFDSRILCHEDMEFNDRVIHFLRRKGLQAFIYTAADLSGYHLHHRGSELYWISKQSKAILVPRRQRLQAAPDSEEDVVDSPLGDPATLLEAVYTTPVPPVPPRTKRLVAGLGRRTLGAVRFLLYGTAR
jgi:Glycosyl transferase family 2